MAILTGMDSLLPRMLLWGLETGFPEQGMLIGNIFQTHQLVLANRAIGTMRTMNLLTLLILGSPVFVHGL